MYFYLWGTYIRMGTYIFQNFIVTVSMGTCIQLVLVFDGYLYSRITVLHLSCLLPLPTFLHNVQWKFKKDSEKGDNKKKILSNKDTF